MSTYAAISEYEIVEAEKAIKDVGRRLDDKTLKKVMTKASKPLIKAARVLAPKANKTVHRYNTPKFLKGVRTPKGSGNIVASYAPGNLGKSIGKIPTRRAKRSILIGARAGVRRKYDGYYAHFVEFGTAHSGAKPFIGPAWQQTKGIVLNNIVKRLKKIVNK